MIEEHPGYLSEQLITYLGNKRALLGTIARALERVCSRLDRRALVTADLFAGSGVVARLLKRYSSRLIVNDLERYSEVINRCYLANSSDIGVAELHDTHRALCAQLTEDALRPGLIATHYAPVDDTAIQPGERVFYTQRNARFLDTARSLIEELPADRRHFFLAPLLVEASIHANTAGVFKGFYKDARTGVGRFGGTGADALQRITAPITLPFPLFSAFECEVAVHRADANTLARTLYARDAGDAVGSGDAVDVGGRSVPLDVVYIDPPYNQHPYGSNYFMLNLLVDYRLPTDVSAVSGIPADWNRSVYNRRAAAAGALEGLVETLNARFLLVSFNSEGFISRPELEGLLARVGRVEVFETRYNAFRGSRNLHARPKHLTEYLFLVERR